jgi:hypothetical protein
MANEASVQVSLLITQTSSGQQVGVQYRNYPNSFVADVAGSFGPTPGAILATTAGVDVDLSGLDTPGFCVLKNLDTDHDSGNYVEYGIWDGATFYPLGALLPGEVYVIRLSPNIREEFTSGTGTSGFGINQLRVKAWLESCPVSVEAFEA